MARKKFGSILLGTTLALSLAACGGEGAGAGAGSNAAQNAAESGETLTVGVAMPTETSERWIADGENVKTQLEAAGYEVNLQFANDVIPTQQQQVDQMITQGADALIIAAIDGTALGSQLEAAGAAGIPVISYDRLIRDSENVDFYVTFDNEEVGRQQGTSLLTGLGVLDASGNETGATGPFNIEVFAGSLDDNNAHFFWSGAMEVLQPHIDSGTLVIKSGQTDIEQAAILRWETATAQARMDDLLTSAYSDGSPLHGVLVPADILSRGVITSLQNRGFGGAQPMPIVTGQDADIPNAKLVADGVQYSTIFKDTRQLAEQAVIATQALAEGEEPEANDTETYDNGVKVVPSYLLPIVVVTKDNVQAALVDTGYYTAEEIAQGKNL
jgi:putative multiple sugar transport system substrate-binding protein